MTVAAHGPAQLCAIGAFPQLERGDGCRNQAPFAQRQGVIERRGNLARVCRLTAEVCKPDRKILKHGVTCVFLRVTPRLAGLSAIRVGQFGQIMAG